VTSVTVPAVVAPYRGAMVLKSLRRRLPRAAVAWFVVAAVCATLAFVGVRDLARRAAAAAPAPTVGVVAATEDIPAGSVLDEDLLAVMPVVAPGPVGALTEPGSVVGALAVTSFAEGEPVTATRLAQPGGALVARVPPGLLGVPIPVAALPDGLASGDRVDVLATFTTARPYTSVVATDVTVLDVGGSGGGSLGTGGNAHQVLLLASPEVARQLVQAAATGSVAVAVRGYEPFAVAPESDG
jgi:Flp pilus assembly protein CpaB